MCHGYDAKDHIKGMLELNFSQKSTEIQEKDDLNQDEGESGETNNVEEATECENIEEDYTEIIKANP